MDARGRAGDQLAQEDRTADGAELAKGDRPTNGAPTMAESTAQEAYGASQIGPFDYCPKLGFREYWYPGIEARTV